MTVIVTYDIDGGWNALKEEAFKLGFYNLVVTTIGDRVLPDTTLFVEDIDPKQALVAFDQAIANASREIGKPIKVEKVCTGTLSNWRIRSDRTK